MAAHTLCMYIFPWQFFFCRSSEQAQGSPLELVEVTSSPPHRAPQPSSSHGWLEEECLGNTPGSSCALQPGNLPALYVSAESWFGGKSRSEHLPDLNIVALALLMSWEVIPYRSQVNASSACLRSSDGVKLSPNCRNRSMYSFFEFSFLYALIFPTPYRSLTVSHPENGWRPTRASHFSCPRWLCSFDRSVIWDSLPFAVWKYRFALMWLQKDSVRTTTLSS